MKILSDRIYRMKVIYLMMFSEDPATPVNPVREFPGCPGAFPEAPAGMEN